jgi:hypothetical protein
MVDNLDVGKGSLGTSDQGICKRNASTWSVD